MSIYTLPADTDVLAARQGEMTASPFGSLGDAPEQTFATVSALVTRTLGAEAALTLRDGKAWPAPDPLAELSGVIAGFQADKAGVERAKWPSIELLVVRVPAAEDRLDALEGKAPEVEGPTLTAMQQAAAEMVVNSGRLPRSEGRDIVLIKELIGHVIAIEARLAALGA